MALKVEVSKLFECASYFFMKKSNNFFPDVSKCKRDLFELPKIIF